MVVAFGYGLIQYIGHSLWLHNGGQEVTARVAGLYIFITVFLAHLRSISHLQVRFE